MWPHVEVFLGALVEGRHEAVLAPGGEGRGGHEGAVAGGPVNLIQVDVLALQALDGLLARPGRRGSQSRGGGSDKFFKYT